jgi:alpha-L-fucosidase
MEMIRSMKIFHHANREHYNPEDPGKIDKWLTGNKKYQKYWLDAVIKELIDKYQPMLLYSIADCLLREKAMNLA